MKASVRGLGHEELQGRKTLCVSGPYPGVAAHDGDEGYCETVQRYYDIAENNAAERIIALKADLKDAPTESFWSDLMEGMTSITGAQYAFVAKRILVDDNDSAVEMPPIGEPGSCLLAVALYYNDGREIKNLHRDYKYLAYGAPCSHMKHDKVFLVPGGLQEFITDNPNKLPFPADAYLGLPLFSEGKCFAHFGLMWTEEGLERRSLGWGYLEMLLHALEDMIEQRVVQGQSFAKSAKGQKLPQVIPQAAITVSQSLKPYARSLSHELRTPMQGVVGMLDIMQATVQESLESQSDARVREIFKTLRENIEVVQDSSRRAGEAADNVVHAYDLNMQVPDSPVPPRDDEGVASQPSSIAADKRPNILIGGNDKPINPHKRRRSASFDWTYRVSAKHRLIDVAASSPVHEIPPHTTEIRSAVEDCGDFSANSSGQETSIKADVPGPHTKHLDFAKGMEGDLAAMAGLRHTKVRELLHIIVNESLRVGGRPDSAIAADTECGEVIEVRARSSKGDASTKIIEWAVDPCVPDAIHVDERDLGKLVSCVFLNAIKFTETGKITLTANLSAKSRFLIIVIRDTGPGIPQDFLPYLFKPFSREDDSLTRQKDGLGLGLLVAKGLARKIGGDLICVRSDTVGSERGSEFELRVPISPAEVCSRPSTPSRTTIPTHGPLFAPTLSSARGRAASPLDRRGPSRTGTPTNAKIGDPPPFVKASSPLLPSSLSRRNSLSQLSLRRGSVKKAPTFDRHLAQKYPLTFLVAEDNKINRKLLVSMLAKLGYATVYEAFDGAEAVQQMALDRAARGEREIDVVLMDLWMPGMDGYEATEKILAMDKYRRDELSMSEGQTGREQMAKGVTVLAVSADVTDEALERAKGVGMEGFMTKPYKLKDLERLIVEYCTVEIGSERT